jgi:ankyrin repeat protein
MKALVENTVDLDVKEGSNEDTALHRLASNGTLNHDLTEILDLVLVDTERSVSINATNRDGVTPLMDACVGQPQTSGELLSIIECLIKHGARSDITTLTGRNVITALASNDRRIDIVTKEALGFIFFYPKSTVSNPQDFVAQTNIDALHDFCSQGKLQTVTYLLELGMSARVNEANRKGWNSLDMTLYSAERARWKFLLMAGKFLSPSELEEANANGDLYADNVYGTNTGGQSSGARARETYWNYPAVISLSSLKYIRG